MLQNRDKSERENFYHNLTQFVLPILAKKKSASASIFSREREKTEGQASRLSPGFYSILEIRYLTLASKASRRSIVPRVRPFFLAQNLKYQASKKHLAWSIMPNIWRLFKRESLFKT